MVAPFLVRRSNGDVSSYKSYGTHAFRDQHVPVDIAVRGPGWSVLAPGPYRRYM